MRGTPGSAGGKTPGWGRGHVLLERLQIPGFLAAALGRYLFLPGCLDGGRVSKGPGSWCPLGFAPRWDLGGAAGWLLWGT